MVIFVFGPLRSLLSSFWVVFVFGRLRFWSSSLAGVSILQAAPICFPSGYDYSSPLETHILALKRPKNIKMVNNM